MKIYVVSTYIYYYVLKTQRCILRASGTNPQDL